MYDPAAPFAQDASLDHALLIAGAAVSQASTPTAVLAERMAQTHRPDLADSLMALVQVFAGHDATAADLLQGSFHPRIAQAFAGNGRLKMMKPGFTLAF